MAFTHGKNAYFSLGKKSTETTAVDISAKLNDVGFPQTSETAQASVFGDGVTKYVLGLKDSTFSLSGLWDSTIDAHLADLVGHETPVTFEYGPVGNDSGAVKYSAVGGVGAAGALLTSYEVSSPVGDVVSFSAEFQITGGVTRGTFV